MGKVFNAKEGDYASTAKQYAQQYAQQIVAREILACRWVQRACQRQLNDLTRFKGKGSPYRFNPKLTDKNGRSFHPADNICAFIERCPHVKGPLSALYILALRDRVFRARWINSVVLMSLKRRFDNPHLPGAKPHKVELCLGCWL